MKLKSLAILLTMLFISGMVFAQNGKSILDKAANKIRNKNLVINFEITTYNKLTPESTIKGEIKCKNNKFVFNSSAMKIWFDGKDQWSLISNSNEVNISTPTKEELEQMLPTYFLTFYQQGEQFIVKPVRYRNENCSEIQINPGKKANFKHLIVIVNDNYQVKNIRYQNKNGKWIQFRIIQLEIVKKIDSKTFIFDQSNYPNYELIDLR